MTTGPATTFVGLDQRPTYDLLGWWHIRPHFGKHVKVADVGRDDIERLHAKITKAGHPRRANTTLAVLSKMFALAVQWRMRPTT
jgi:hypothetical protein